MQTIQCPKCPATFDANLAAYAQRHAEIHTRELRNHNRAVEADKAITALIGPLKR